MTARLGERLKKLDDLGIADRYNRDYTTDNGAETFSWPDGGTTPFRGENTNWEGGYRVPALVRWPGLVQPRTEINDIFSAEDWVPTLVAAAGNPDIKDKLLQGSVPATRPSRCTSTATTSATCLPPKAPTSAASSSTGRTTVTSPACGFDQYKVVFMSSKPMAWRSGCSRLCRCAHRRYSTYAPTPSSLGTRGRRL